MAIINEVDVTIKAAEGWEVSSSYCDFNRVVIRALVICLMICTDAFASRRFDYDVYAAGESLVLTSRNLFAVHS